MRHFRVGSRGASQSAAWTVLCMGSVALWTLLEYLLHRFRLHHAPYLKEMHLDHHIDERAQIDTPTWLSLGAFLAIMFLPIFLATDFFVASAVTDGLMIGYLWYIQCTMSCITGAPAIPATSMG